MGHIDHYETVFTVPYGLSYPLTLGGLTFYQVLYAFDRTPFASVGLAHLII